MHAHHFGPHPGHVGGMATVLALLAELQIGADSVTVHPTWIPKDRRRTIRLTLTALGAVQRLGPGDVVHVHLSTRGSLIREGVILLDASRRGLPTVASLHGADFAEFAGRNPEFVRRVLRHARVVTALSDDAEAAAHDLAPDAVTRVVPNPIPIQEGAPRRRRPIASCCSPGRSARGRESTSWRAPGLSSIAGFRPRAVSSSGLRRPHAPSARGPDDPPARSPAAIGELLQEARVAVLPSRAEGMPMFLLEAMAAARPFVATPVGANARLAETRGHPGSGRGPRRARRRPHTGAGRPGPGRAPREFRAVASAARRGARRLSPPHTTRSTGRPRRERVAAAQRRWRSFRAEPRQGRPRRPGSRRR